MANTPSEESELDSFDHSSKSRRRKRTVFNKEQINVLVNYFAKRPYPGIEDREKLSSMLKIPESQIQVWFQNRRARHPKHPKKHTSCLENRPLSPILEEDISNENLGTPSASGCLSWAGEPGQEAGPNSSCFFEESSAVPTTENAYMDGYGISPNPHFVSSQTMRPTIEFQPGDLSRTDLSQGSSMQWPSFWALQETKGSENNGLHTSFCGEMKPPMQQQQQQQQQRWTRDQFYPYYQPVPFQYTQEHQYHLQQPYPQQQPILQQLTPSQHQSPQEQTQVPPLVREKEQQNEFLPSFKQQELHPSDLYKITGGCGSTLFPHDGHLASSMGDVAAPLDHVAVPQGAMAAPQGHQTDHQGDVETPGRSG